MSEGTNEEVAGAGERGGVTSSCDQLGDMATAAIDTIIVVAVVAVVVVVTVMMVVLKSHLCIRRRFNGIISIRRSVHPLHREDCQSAGSGSVLCCPRQGILEVSV